MENLDSLSNDLSFVILGTDSLLAEQPIGHLPSTSLSSLNPALITSQSLTSLNVEQKLDQLLKENADLKNALNQNNLAMKTKFETLAEWQQEVLLTHQTHKQKFSETRELVMKLRAENTQLKNYLSDKKIISNTSGISFDSTSEPLYKKENEKLKAENLILVKERNAFREECTRLTLKISNLESVIRNKSAEMDTLKSTYDSVSITECSGPSRNASYASVSHSDKFSLPGWACIPEKLAERQNLAVEAEIDVLKNLLKEEKSRSDDVRSSMLKIEEQLHAEVTNRKNIDELLKIKNEELSKVRNDLCVKEKVLATTIAELNQEREKNIQLSADAEKLSLLQTQVEAYESDFKEERAAREKLVGEKESLEQKIRELQRAQNELQAREVQPQPDSSTSSTLTSRRYECPLCPMRFYSMDDCATHVDSCLDNPMYPS